MIMIKLYNYYNNNNNNDKTPYKLLHKHNPIFCMDFPFCF
jgi:hypothetical protein